MIKWLNEHWRKYPHRFVAAIFTNIVFVLFVWYGIFVKWNVAVGLFQLAGVLYWMMMYQLYRRSKRTGR